MAHRNLEVMSEELGIANELFRSQARELAHLNMTLAEERDRLKVLLESIPDEVWFCDAVGNVTAANPAALRGVGLPSNGEAFQPFPDWATLEMLDPDGQPRPLRQTPLLRALRGEHVRGQEEIVRNLETGEWRHREASGEAIRDSSGQIAGAVLVVRDITEQTHAQQALRSNQAIYRAIAQSYPNGGIYVFDHDLRYLVVEGSVSTQDARRAWRQIIWEAWTGP
jgi:PAS domain-containing protein